jgi:hypothetical protein
VLHPRHNFKQAGFSGAIQTQNADLRAVKVGKINILQNETVRRIDLRNTLHCVDNFLGHGASWHGILSLRERKKVLIQLAKGWEEDFNSRPHDE